MTYLGLLHDLAGRVIRGIQGNTAKDGTGTWLCLVLNAEGHPMMSHNITGIGHGVKTVTTAGSHEALAASTAAKLLVVQAQTDNTNKVAIGTTGVDATVATGNGIILDPGDTFTLPVDDLADVYVDALVSGEGVRYTYFT